MSEQEPVILVIYHDYTQCSGCGGGTDPDATVHDQAKDWKTPDRACGRTFTQLATEFSGEWARDWCSRRSDLEYIGVGWLAGDGTRFVLDIPAEHAFKNDAYKYSVRPKD